ncbi:LysR family transcriptional regulator [Rhizobium sp. 60-20]|uniref:helix-turn-helix domain-containing protein n=1 Tax=Rhizobium sp. 60-20 TaxID=1895819 RepID=UPI0025E825A9|nr:LysR family transcriptional regulator [Rhizobium sp. 60-20]
MADHGSFRRAAEALDLSQSTGSRRVQALERRLGTPIFIRDRCGVRLTHAGQRFLRDATIHQPVAPGE